MLNFAQLNLQREIMLQGFETWFKDSLLKHNSDVMMATHSIPVKFWVAQQQNLFSILFCQCIQTHVICYLALSSYLIPISPQRFTVSVVHHYEK